MQPISLQAAATLTELSVRTLRRRIADGSIHYATDNDDYHKTMIRFDSIQDAITIELNADDLLLIEAADAGNAHAQVNLALLFLEKQKPKSAIYWLETAAKQECADAMQLLGSCYLSGNGLPKNENLALMWIAKAASLGHVIALAQIQALRVNN